MIHPDILTYHQTLLEQEKAIGEILANTIHSILPEAENKIWHAHPVWFLEGNPIVGYSKLKDGIRLLFWSGQSFEEDRLKPEGKFKAAEIRYTEPEQIIQEELVQWLLKSKEIQWDYKNLVKKKGLLERLK